MICYSTVYYRVRCSESSTTDVSVRYKPYIQYMSATSYHRRRNSSTKHSQKRICVYSVVIQLKYTQKSQHMRNGYLSYWRLSKAQASLRVLCKRCVARVLSSQVKSKYFYSLKVKFYMTPEEMEIQRTVTVISYIYIYIYIYIITVG